MKRLFMFLFLIASIISCQNTGSEPDSFEAQRIGNWLLSAPDTADYVGTHQHKIKSAEISQTETDTIHITSSNGYALTLVDRNIKQGGSQYVNISFTDSSYVYSPDMEQLELIIETPSMYLATGGYSTAFTSNYLTSTARAQYACENDAQSIETIAFKYYFKGQDKIHRIYIIDVDGIRDILEEMLCS